MDKETSDLDVRGIALNPKSDILLGKDFEQVVNTDTDTTIYSFNKMLQLLSSNNPNTIEILGCKPEHYLYLHPIGQELLDNRHMFLSKICIQSFAGYAGSQLRRLENKSARLVGQTERELHIYKSMLMHLMILKDVMLCTKVMQFNYLLMNQSNQIMKQKFL